jgi:hypothetical protein
MDDELVITEENFDQYFFDVRKNRPKKGQVMARYRAVADFINTPMKYDIINLLKIADKILPATQLMRKFHGATDKDAVNVLLEMANDLLSMSEEEVAKKPYKMVIEYFFYTKKEHIPEDDPHWECISIRNLDEFLSRTEDGVVWKTKIVEN